MAIIQVGNRYFPSSAIQILTQDNTQPTVARTIDVSEWVPSGALWYWVGCPLARAWASPNSGGGPYGTIDMAWTCRLMEYPNEDFDKWCQLALQNQLKNTFQECSGKTICIPNHDNAREFIWRTRCPDLNSYYDSAELTLTLLGWEMPD